MPLTKNKRNIQSFYNVIHILITNFKITIPIQQICKNNSTDTNTFSYNCNGMRACSKQNNYR